MTPNSKCCVLPCISFCPALGWNPHCRQCKSTCRKKMQQPYCGTTFAGLPDKRRFLLLRAMLVLKREQVQLVGGLMWSVWPGRRASLAFFYSGMAGRHHSCVPQIGLSCSFTLVGSRYPSVVDAECFV